MHHLPEDPVRVVTKCRACAANDWCEVLSFGPMPLANAFRDPTRPEEPEFRAPLDVIVCRRCRLMCLRHVVPAEVLYREYIYISSDSRQVVDHMQALATHLVQRFGIPAGSLVVEVGSNIGSQLACFQAAGMRVLGFDPALNIAKVARASGIDTVAEFFTEGVAAEVVRRHGPARLLLGRHVFAHIDDLSDVLRGAHALLDPHGIMAIEVPYVLDLLASTQFDTIYHEHLSYFSVTTLRHLLEAHGFHLVDVTHHAVHGGSIVVCASRTGGHWPVAPSVEAFVESERTSGLLEDATYHAFASRTRDNIRAFTTLVRGLAGQGKRIAAYGAPAKGVTLLNACGLQFPEVRYAIDTTPSKQGKWLPGTGIPIVSPARGHADLPDYFLLLPWNYAEEILARERALMEGGVAFIVPVPSPRVVGPGAPARG